MASTITTTPKATRIAPETKPPIRRAFAICPSLPFCRGRHHHELPTRIRVADQRSRGYFDSQVVRHDAPRVTEGGGEEYGYP